MKIKIQPLMGAYVAFGTIYGLNYVAFGKSHADAMDKLFQKHRINCAFA